MHFALLNELVALLLNVSKLLQAIDHLVVVQLAISFRPVVLYFDLRELA